MGNSDISTEMDEAINAACRQSLDCFAMRAFRELEPAVTYEQNWHIGCICYHLEALFYGEILRLVINLPPRTLKSYLGSAAFPAWCLGKKPSEKFIDTGYGFTVVEQNAMKCRKIIGSTWYRKTFPRTIIDANMDRRTHFCTTVGGQYYADTALSTITGVGCGIMILDDPIKPMESLSEQVRNTTNENIRATLLNRFDDKRTGRLLIIMQRSHVDDPTGNLIRDGGYTILKLPAETKKSIHVSMKGRTWDMEEGSLLFPARLGRKELDQTKLDLSEYHYCGQYLQEPVPIGGGEFKQEWISYYRQGSTKPTNMNICILVDQAGGEELNKKKKKLSDWSVILVIGLAPDNNYYLLDAVRDRFNPTERIETIFQMHRKWNQLTGRPPKVGCEQIGLMTDTHYLQEKQNKETYHFPIIPLGSGQRISKEERIRKLIPIMQNRRFYIPESLIYLDQEGRRWDLSNEFVNVELATFPKSRYDDIMDCACRVLDEDLAMIFPKPKVGTVEKARRAAAETADSWEDF